MEKTKRKIDVEFPINDVTNKCILQISQTAKAITFLYHAIENYNQSEFIPLQTNTFQILAYGDDKEQKIAKEDVLSWILNKAFTDFISGITDSLIVTHRFFHLRDFANYSLNASLSKATVEETLKKIESKPTKMSLPKLIEEVEAKLGSELSFKKEIKSINAVRNCIVHDNNIVSEKHLKGDISQLSLHYIDKVAFFKKGNEWIEFTWEIRQTPILVNELLLVDTPKTIVFEKETKISIDQNVFNGIFYTCSQFVNHLQSLLPAPNYPPQA